MFWVFSLALTLLHAAIVTESAGLVGGDITTTREVQIGDVVDKVLDSKEGKPLVLTELALKNMHFADATSSYLLEQAAEKEARSFSVAEAAEAEVRDGLARIDKAAGGQTFWQGLDADSVTVKRILTTKIIARNFIKIKSDSMIGIVTDSEAQTYFEKNRLKFGSSGFDSFKENIKSFLAQQQKQDRLRSWFDVLKKKYKIRNLLVENVKTPQQTADAQKADAQKSSPAVK